MSPAGAEFEPANGQLTDQPDEQFADGFDEGVPNPLDHAAPDAEIAEARLAIGAGLAAADAPLAESELEYEAEPDDGFQEFESGALESEPDGASSGHGGTAGPPGPPAPPRPSRRPGAPQPEGAHAVAPRPWLGARLLAFREGSWRELQRVQWPDRRQVVQATGVVLGFVIVASVFLGVAGLIDGKIVHTLIYGGY